MYTHTTYMHTLCTPNDYKGHMGNVGPQYWPQYWFKVFPILRNLTNNPRALSNVDQSR